MERALVFMCFFYLTFSNLQTFAKAEVCSDKTVTISVNDKSCSDTSEVCSSQITPETAKYIFYEVNPPEGFNLRRDVYLRLAIMVKKFSEKERKHGRQWKLVLPPWGPLYHWRSTQKISQRALPWNLFFDIDSLRSFAPVIELHELLDIEKNLTLDKIYMLQHYKDAFENGVFVEKWEINDSVSCEYSGNFWGQTNVVVRDIQCVNFQGVASKLTEILSLNSYDRMIMFTNAETALHDEYGTSLYWEARKSMRFNSDLVQIASDFIATVFKCGDEKCNNYLGIHWRRRDFAAGRRKDVPSIKGTVKQISEALMKNDLIKYVFIATDAPYNETKKLLELLLSHKIHAKLYEPTDHVILKYKDGGVAIIDQIICSRSAYFIGTHESTFTYRIQEEREIMGFNSDTTFNRFCPDTGKCENPSRWTIIND